jgi:hypothetical protein
MVTLIDYWHPDRETILGKEENTPLSQPQFDEPLHVIGFLAAGSRYILKKKKKRITHA